MGVEPTVRVMHRPTIRGVDTEKTLKLYYVWKNHFVAEGGVEPPTLPPLWATLRPVGMFYLLNYSASIPAKENSVVGGRLPLDVSLPIDKQKITKLCACCFFIN